MSERTNRIYEEYNKLKNSKCIPIVKCEFINGNINNWKVAFEGSPYSPYEDGIFPSFSSVQEYLHPIQNRTLNIKELQRLMNYPDSYDFSDPENKCKIPVCQAMAQGVPANFGKWIAEQVKLAFDNELNFIENADIIFQDHIKGKYKIYTVNEFNELEFLSIDKNGINL